MGDMRPYHHGTINKMGARPGFLTMGDPLYHIDDYFPNKIIRCSAIRLDIVRGDRAVRYHVRDRIFMKVDAGSLLDGIVIGIVWLGISICH